MDVPTATKAIRGGCTQPTWWAHLEYSAWGIGEAVSLDPTGHLLHQVTLPRYGIKGALPNKQKQTQGGCQNEETKKYGPNERTDQNSRKRTQQNGEIINLSDAEFKTLVIRMLSEIIEYGKNIREEMKATLSEIKKNPQGTNSEGKKAGVQINDLEHNEEIHSQPEQNEETKIF